MLLKLTLRTTRTSGGAEARALGVLGADRVLVGVPAGVGGQLATTILVVNVALQKLVESEVRAAGLEVLEEGFVGRGGFEVGVYLLEGRRQGGLVEGGIARERAVLRRARGLRREHAKGAAKTYGVRDEVLLLSGASLWGHLEAAGHLLTDEAEVDVQCGKGLLLASGLGRRGRPGGGREGRGGRGGREGRG